ncbi:MAG: hypothetical protein KDD43_00860 [Bdellovibrionales bacterium]|nr:hypothetical protein [Bdellovibrionales bacterium]
MSEADERREALEKVRQCLINIQFRLGSNADFPEDEAAIALQVLRSGQLGLDMMTAKERKAYDRLGGLLEGGEA